MLKTVSQDISNASAIREPLGLRLYRSASRIAAPLAELALRKRIKDGKEDPSRIQERRGLASHPRPDGQLIWIHGASVGESLSVLPFIDRIHAENNNVHFLVTTGTVTSARLMAERLPSTAIHQFAPLDHPRFIEQFLNHWQPDSAIFVESEFWPNLISQTRRNVPFMALVNGRVSPKSFEEWSSKPDTIRFMLSAFDLLLAQDQKNAERLSILSGKTVKTLGNIKYAAPPLPADEHELEQFRRTIGERPVWLAASTHPGEETAIFAAHKSLKSNYASMLTLLAPRHPERGLEIAALAAENGLNIKRRSLGEPITPDTDIYIADTLGELGLFYRLSDISFVGGSLTEKGGHNPLEPARLGGAILHGPHTFNFADTYAEMRGAGGSALVRNDRELATATWRLLSDPKTRQTMAEAAHQAALASADRILNAVSTSILSNLPSDGQSS